MYTGTLIEDLIAAVERVKEQAGDFEIHNVPAEARVEDNDTEGVTAGSLSADVAVVHAEAGMSSDFVSPLDA